MRKSSVLFWLMLLLAAPAFAEEEEAMTVEEFLAQPTGRVSVDFVDTSITDVAYFVTEQTGIGFIFSLTDDPLINWSQMRVERADLLENFNHALSTVHLGCYPVNEAKTLYRISLIEPPKEPAFRRISSVMKGGRVLLSVDGEEFFAAEDAPYQLQERFGAWYALMP